MIMSAKHDLEFSRHQPIGLGRVDAISRRREQDQKVSHSRLITGPRERGR